ncbi:MAG: threonine synthase [Candidatus Hodarchaeales archaeon]
MSEHNNDYYKSTLYCPKCGKTIEEKDIFKESCQCGFRYRIEFDYEAIKERIDKKELESRVFGHEKYIEFFPLQKKKNLINLGAGGTPLIKAKRLVSVLGLKNLYFKLEIGNPSGSFKDRPISIGVSKAVEQGSKTLTAASSGNAAAALATYGARAGIEVVVFVPKGAPQGKIAQLSFLGAKVVRVSVVEEGIDPTVTLFKAAYQKYGWTPCPSFGPFNPFQFEGTKSLGFEIVEQLDWQSPDWILCNTGSGGLLAGTYRGFEEFGKIGLIATTPKMVAVQPTECAPIVEAAKARIKPLEFKDWTKTPNTIAGGLADPHPWDADSALEAIYKSKGTGVGVLEPDIARTQKLLAAKEGIFAEPSGTAALAGLEMLINDGTIDKDDVIVVPITGTGFKDPEVVLQNTTIYDVIRPDLDELRNLLNKMASN